MKRTSHIFVALFAGFALAGTAIAQGRHDERPHGYDKAKAQAMAAGTPETVKTMGSGGRHDKKPHGVTKKVAPAKSAAPPSAAAPVATPEAAKTGQ